jgi:lysophospholipase L1-like esterase
MRISFEGHPEHGMGRRRVSAKATLIVLTAIAFACGTVSVAAASTVPGPGPVKDRSATEGTIATKRESPERATVKRSATAAPATATGALSTVVTVVVHGGYTAAGIGMRNLGHGTIAVSGVPAGGTVKSAFLLWDVLADQNNPGFAQGTFNGTPVTGTEWASGASPCWSVAGNWSYEANVTGLVGGNGFFTLAGFAGGQSNGADPWSAGSAPPLLDGASLVVVYELPSMPAAVIQIAEGAVMTNAGHPAEATLDGFMASSPASATATYIVADGQEAGNKAAFGGATLPAVSFPGADPQAVPDYSRGNLWDTVTADVSAHVTPGDTSAALAVTGHNDCVVWVGQVLAVAGQPVRTLVAMGDSYSSGEGNPPFDPGTDVKKGDHCHRSVQAWPRLLAAADPTITLEAHMACSGATTKDITSSRFNNEPSQIRQLEALAQPPQLITITIGGNDFGFGSVLANCFLANCVIDHRLVTARNYIEKTFPGVLGQAYDAIHAAEPGTSVAVIGYPRIFPTRQSATRNCNWLSSTERTQLNGLATLVNSVIGTAARKKGFTYVPTLNAFHRHEECTARSWLYPIAKTPLPYDGHPLLAGQQALEKIVRAALG